MTYECGICGKRRKPERMIYSRHTKNRYCREHVLKPSKRKRVAA